MKNFGKILKAGLLSVFIIAIMTMSIFAWLPSDAFISTDMSASSVNFYFAGGDGTVNNPFIINKKRHIYNLSWLQYLGRFQSKTTYFSVEADIDMDGIAIPPIGTEANPFYGTFKGNGHVIKNVWVSTIAQEIVSDLVTENFNAGSKVGFFGVIDSVATLVNGDYVYSKLGYADDFFLENIKISTATNNATVGLIAGYANGSLTKVGVSNAYMRLSSGLNVKSDHSLIGEKGALEFWSGEPGGTEGGDLVIDPTPVGGTAYASTAAGVVKPVPEAIKDRAFYVGALPAAQNRFTTYFLRSSMVYDYNGTATEKSAPTVADPSFIAKFNRSRGNSAVMVDLGMTVPSVANAANKVTGVLSNGSNIILPRNSIYFRPQGKGICSVAFSTQSAGETLKVAIYRFKRVTPGVLSSDIDASTFQKAASFTGVTSNNGDTHYFEYELTAAEFRQGYEYAIGVDEGMSKSPSLIYFRLPGTNVEGLPDEAPLIKSIDYVYRSGPNETFPNLADVSYVPTNTMLKITGTTTSEFKIYYHKAWKSGEPKAYLYYSRQGLGVTVTDLVTNNSEGRLEAAYSGTGPAFFDTT